MTAPTTTNTSTSPRTTARRTAGRRHAVRFAGIALAAGTLLGGFAQTAHADSPPAPKPTMPIGVVAQPGPGLGSIGQIGDTPPGPNTGKVGSFNHLPGDTWANVTFSANRPKVIVTLSSTKPYWVGNTFTMGPVSPVLLHGTPVAGNPNDLAAAPQWSYSLAPEGLEPATMYYIVYATPGTAGQKVHYQYTQFKTKTRYVRMTPLSVHISDDSDWGPNAGDLTFGARVAPDAGPNVASEWAYLNKRFSLDTGDNLDLSKTGLGQTVATKKSTIYVQVQGVDNDEQSYENCALEGGTQSPMQYSDKCYDTSFAEAYVTLPNSHVSGVQTQTVHATVNRGPRLEFQSEVLVESWLA